MINIRHRVDDIARFIANVEVFEPQVLAVVFLTESQILGVVYLPHIRNSYGTSDLHINRLADQYDLTYLFDWVWVAETDYVRKLRFGIAIPLWERVDSGI